MQRIKFILTAFFIICIVANSTAQSDRMIEQQLHRLKLTIERTTSFINALPESEVKQKMLLYLQSANEEYEKAVEFANNDRPGLAKIHIVAAYQYLKMIESLIKDHPILKIKFRERLDLKIQQAEGIVQTQQNPEALHMLNRAKFFRQRAYLAFRGDQSYNALEYYRLALFFAEKSIQLATVGSDQSVSDSQNLLSETEMLLERASQVVEDSQNPQLRNMVEKANLEMQEVRRLHINDRNDKTTHRKLLALQRSLYRIIDLAENVPQKEDERLRLDFETLQFSVQSLQSDLQNVDSPVTNRLYLRLSNLINTIDGHIRDGNLVLARQQILTANRLVLNIYRLISAQSVSSSDELKVQIDRAKQNYDELQSTATDASFSPELLRIIKTNLDHAEKANGKGNHLAASFYLKMANRLILKFNRMRLVDSLGKLEGKSVEADLQRLDGLLNRIELNENTDDDFAIRYENSKAIYKIARNAFLKNDLKVCQELTTMGINLITQ
jgi:hypothetical protein